jgi:hypothetical protein
MQAVTSTVYSIYAPENGMSFNVSAGEEIIALDILQDDYVLAFKVSYFKPKWHVL